MVSDILVWNKEVGFVQINEGTGDNLFSEDVQHGYVDYVMLNFLEYDGVEFQETDSMPVLLTELYQEKFESETEVVQYLIANEWIPEVDYVYLYAK